MNSRVLLLVACVVLSAMTARAADEEAILASEVIRTMRADKLAGDRIEAILLARCREQRCDAEHRACLSKPHPEDFVERFSRRLRRELTIPEMKSAIEYFQSEVGDRHIEILRGEHGLSKATLFNQEPADRVRMLAFLDSPAGYRLVTRGFLTNSTDVVQWIRRAADDAWRRCHA